MSTTINSPAELDELPDGSEFEDAEGDSGLKASGFVYLVPGFAQPVRSDFFAYPVSVKGIGAA
ncbi:MULTISPECIES: hypothetical protein [unclassified Streptomyces]|uniref:hypothetical protein n=1 Tax=unclassified Streptomyces TaxID=2593676 RepID=UPI0003757DAC|nr:MULTISPECIES: hypothetical protein [unclassified Streptomyces]MYT31723.1 hypothetical protein [Streptomyces sp. SID8354]